MVGKEAEQSGIIRSGAKLVNAVSNSIVPKITIVMGNSFGAGNYALCGKAYDPHFILAWPGARYAVMGGTQAAQTLFTIEQSAAERSGGGWNDKEAKERLKAIAEKYEKQMDIRYGAARGWVDAIIAPHETRDHLIRLLKLVKRSPPVRSGFHTGVIQV
jgi:acetyl-CoA carboxylase carboxyltransferase component